MYGNNTNIPNKYDNMFTAKPPPTLIIIISILKFYKKTIHIMYMTTGKINCMKKLLPNTRNYLTDLIVNP